ncbi:MULTISPECIES: DUF3299 domain-containing protein [Aliiglaciecola]|uniref:DUF3299 domain-containing protein n=2 Tax=Alteromonadaceae TaxID=72275 RepID=UPI0020907B34|nr:MULTISPECIES: DUF3299 domain-containing protein [Aliiglaciecola]MDO6711706.1 DUF3299 domain-containing protein [Aliiglaciecola sp. 2_MG-2023]MDO6752777.1 DUF3299 domain-containing protein [Aliiglaciecola sp. 1_MG-2023]
MNRKIALGRCYSIGFLSLILLLCTSAQAESNPIYDEIEWIELMPQSDLDALLDPPDFLNEIKDGSELDSVQALSGMSEKSENVERFQQALTSTRIIQSFDKKSIRIPGFIVPLSSDDQKRVVEFFIVPYFGACLHMPPPPPNQIIYGKFSKGIKLTQLDVAFWFEGVINIETNSNETGTSAYAMTLDNIEIYD